MSVLGCLAVRPCGLDAPPFPWLELIRHRDSLAEVRHKSYDPIHKFAGGLKLFFFRSNIALSLMTAIREVSRRSFKRVLTLNPLRVITLDPIISKVKYVQICSTLLGGAYHTLSTAAL